MTLLITPSTWLGWAAPGPAPLAFVILQVQVSKIAGHDEDVVLLVVPDESRVLQMCPSYHQDLHLGVDRQHD